MTSLSPTRAVNTRHRPATSPYDWLNSIRLSADELKTLREHVERSLQLADGEVQPR